METPSAIPDRWWFLMASPPKVCRNEFYVCAVAFDLVLTTSLYAYHLEYGKWRSYKELPEDSQIITFQSFSTYCAISLAFSCWQAWHTSSMNSLTTFKRCHINLNIQAAVITASGRQFKQHLAAQQLLYSCYSDMLSKNHIQSLSKVLKTGGMGTPATYGPSILFHVK